MQLIPQAREIAKQAAESGNEAAGENVNRVIDEILARPEHQWFELELKPREAPAGDGEDEAQVRDMREAVGKVET